MFLMPDKRGDSVSTTPAWMIARLKRMSDEHLGQYFWATSSRSERDAAYEIIREREAPGADFAALMKKIEAENAPPKLEYKVIWQREGFARVQRIYQTERGALDCAEWQGVADDAESRPRLEYGPYIDTREVGSWVPIEAEEEV